MRQAPWIVAAGLLVPCLTAHAQSPVVERLNKEAIVQPAQAWVRAGEDRCTQLYHEAHDIEYRLFYSPSDWPRVAEHYRQIQHERENLCGWYPDADDPPRPR